ncbi:hypothetical protein ONE63_009904 [Megalurothrips usitatus]|uniref:Uncharacterized protein n=1 Tax=Megalurothrips usitatus TaxID=439358 RepID=A0AAV7XKB0_9NEOP|nr:hypothetical protein ONE63_009904 [Megalurothrips usitatus]
MIATKPLVTQAELERYLPPRTCHQLDLGDVYSPRLDSPEDGPLSPLPLSPLPPLTPLTPLTQTQLTQADLEEYARTCEDSLLRPHHQHQGSYAQSEGYHSYVSSSDSTTTAPFLDSASSSETLKWHGSLSDVSVASSALGLVAQRHQQQQQQQQLIAHSSRVQTPQRHHSESVLYLGGGGGSGSMSPAGSGGSGGSGGAASPIGVLGALVGGRADRADRDREERNNERNQRRLFPVSTYTVLPEHQESHRYAAPPLLFQVTQPAPGPRGLPSPSRSSGLGKGQSLAGNYRRGCPARHDAGPSRAVPGRG